MDTSNIPVIGTFVDKENLEIPIALHELKEEEFSDRKLMLKRAEAVRKRSPDYVHVLFHGRNLISTLNPERLDGIDSYEVIFNAAEALGCAPVKRKTKPKGRGKKKKTSDGNDSSNEMEGYVKIKPDTSHIYLKTDVKFESFSDYFETKK